jgi:hypothetical protein
LPDSLSFAIKQAGYQQQFAPLIPNSAPLITSFKEIIFLHNHQILTNNAAEHTNPYFGIRSLRDPSVKLKKSQLLELSVYYQRQDTSSNTLNKAIIGS